MKKANRSYILLEILLSLLIFSVAAWICLTLFGAGAKAARRADELSNAPQICASALERARSDGEPVEMYYDENWQPLDWQPKEGYGVGVTLVENGATVEATANVARQENGEVIYTLTTAWLSEEVSR